MGGGGLLWGRVLELWGEVFMEFGEEFGGYWVAVGVGEGLSEVGKLLIVFVLITWGI